MNNKLLTAALVAALALTLLVASGMAFAQNNTTNIAFETDPKVQAISGYAPGPSFSVAPGIGMSLPRVPTNPKCFWRINNKVVVDAMLVKSIRVNQNTMDIVMVEGLVQADKPDHDPLTALMNAIRECKWQLENK